MRELDFDAVIIFSKILDKTDIVIDIQKIIKEVKIDEVKDVDGIKQVGKEVGISIVVQLAGSLMKSLHKAGPEVKEFIAYVSEKSVADVSKMKLKEIKDFFVELIKHEDFADFFKQATELE